MNQVKLQKAIELYGLKGIHPAADLMPFMTEIEYSELLKDVQKNGFLHKVKVTSAGLVIDGRNRLCVSIDASKDCEFETYDPSDPVAYVLSENLQRRHLTTGQRSMIAIEVEKIYAAEAKERQAEAGAKNLQEFKNESLVVTNSSQLTKTENKEPDPPKHKSEDNKSAKKAADAVGVGQTAVKQAKKIAISHPEIAEKVKSGELTLNKAVATVKIQERKADIEQQNQAETPELQGLFDIIVIDPPWPYGREYDPETSRVANPYPEMPLSEIIKIELPVKDDSVIFLWTTHKFLPDSFELLKTWGFEYKACMVWDKEKIGMGKWLRMQCEFCLLGIKGKPFWNNTTEIDIIRESRREHSRKPDKLYEMIDKLYNGNFRKLDYFARGKREGWDVFGNDISKF